MEQSTNFNFNLPSKSDETSADIDLISDNFRTVDDVVKQVDDVVKQVQDDVSKMPTNLVNGSADGSLRGIATRAEGNGYIIGENAVAIGDGTKAIGSDSHAEGGNTTALGFRSHAEGAATTASGSTSHAEGCDTTASGDISHAEGWETTASGTNSHAEGFGTTASGQDSHAEGFITTASGRNSHAEGVGTIASGVGSHAEGSNTIASWYCQHVQGKCNIEDTNNRYAHIVGNGEEGKNRSNAHTLDWNGNAWFAGDVYVGGTSQDDESATKLSSVATDITQVKEKLDGIEEGANKTIVDSELSDTSTNPLQNKVVSAKIKNHASFYVCSTKDNVEYIKLGKFTGNSNGERAIFTINGKSGWNNKNDGGLKILTLSSNHCDDSTSNDIHTGGTFYTFGHSNDNASSVIEGIATDIVLVRASGYSTKEVDVYIKISPTKYISYFVTVDYSDNCSWTTSTQEITSSETSPTEGATSYFTVPKKHIADSNNLKELKTPKDAVTSNLYTAPYCQSGIIADSLTELNKYRTTIGTATVSEEWNNIISVRHRNGADDGSNYGMYLRAPMIYESNLMWRQQFGASWKAEKTLLDSSNFTNYIPYETGTCTLTAYSDTVFGGSSRETLLNWQTDTSKYYTTGSVNTDGTLSVQGAGNARIINSYNINATGTVGVEFGASGTGAIKIEIKGGGTTYTSGNISLSTNTQKIQITHATSGITVLNDVEINIYASGETALKIENLLKMTEASTRTFTGNYDLIGNQVTVSVLVDNLQNGGEIALYPLPFVPKIEKSGVCGVFGSSPYSAVYYDIYSTTARIYLNDAPQASKQLTFYYTV